MLDRFKSRLFGIVDLINLDLKGHCKIEKHHILLACMPKTGSTFISNVIGEIPGFEKVSLVPGYERREQELDVISLVYNNRKNYIAQHHVRFSYPLSEQIQQFGLSPIVLVRDIFDCVVSIRDHYRREDVVHSMAFVREDFAEWDNSRLEVFIATMVIPWYINFYISWLEYENKLLINYSDILENPLSCTSKILTHVGVHIDNNVLMAALSNAEAGNTRKNKAVIGRGRSIDPQAREKILEMARYYDEYDLRPIGL